MKRHLKDSLSFLLAAILIFYALKNGIISHDAIYLLSEIHIHLWLPTFFISLIIFWLLGTQLKASLHPQLRTISSRTAFYISVSNIMLNYFPAKAGTVAKGIYLKKTEGISYKKYTESLILSTVTSALVASTLGFIAALNNPHLAQIITAKLSNTNSAMLTMTLCTLLGILVAITTRLIKIKIIRKYLNAIKTRKLVYLTIAATALFTTYSTRLFLCFSSLGYTPTITEIVLIQSAVSLSVFIALTPGNIGIKEGIIMVAASAVLIDPKIALFAGLLDRLSAVTIAFCAGPFCSNRLLNNSTNYTE